MTAIFHHGLAGGGVVFGGQFSGRHVADGGFAVHAIGAEERFFIDPVAVAQQGFHCQILPDFCCMPAHFRNQRAIDPVLIVLNIVAGDGDRFFKVTVHHFDPVGRHVFHIAFALPFAHAAELFQERVNVGCGAGLHHGGKLLPRFRGKLKTVGEVALEPCKQGVHVFSVDVHFFLLWLEVL